MGVATFIGHYLLLLKQVQHVLHGWWSLRYTYIKKHYTWGGSKLVPFQHQINLIGETIRFSSYMYCRFKGCRLAAHRVHALEDIQEI